jgi:hypothetical protein
MNSTIRTPFLFKKRVAIRFFADNICLNFLTLSGEWCLFTPMVSTFTNETQVSSLLLVKCDSEIHRHLCDTVLISQSLSQYLRFVRIRE